MRTFWLVLFAVGFAANGLFMLLSPSLWYDTVPGVHDTGPLNAHFVRDIGCAYLVGGLSLGWLVRDQRAWPAGLAAGAFVSLHAVIHIVGIAGGHVHGGVLASDLLLVIVPAVVVTWLAWPRVTS